jgi:hypothetical protein
MGEPPRYLETPAGWLILIAVLALSALVYNYWHKRRERALERVARETGFIPDEDRVSRDNDGFLHLPIFEHNIGLTDVMRGSVETGEAVILDCHMAAGDQRYWHTVVCLKIKHRELPAFQLRPEKVVHKLGAMFGQQDIDFPDFPRFSRMYLLRGQKEAALRGLFTSRVLSFFERHPGWCVEGEGEWLAVYRIAIAPDPHHLKKFLALATEIAKTFS